ncbi:MAG TPA: DEAD/DEAH box helicase, partial [Kofleriaceae bacterium]
AGKTVIFSELARMARKQVLVLAHREELLGQARDKLARALGDASVVALERGGERAPAEAKVLVASLRSLHPERLAKILEGRDFGLVIYDECHHAAADDNLRILRQLGSFEKAWDGTLLGFTATTARGDGKGLDQIFEEIVYSKTLPDLIDAGYLARLKGFRINTAADLSRLTPSFTEDELEEAVDIEDRNALVARAIQELARDRRTIAFCVTVNHARNLSRALNAIGVSASIVHGEMPSAIRAQRLAEFRAGKIQVITNVAVLTEGFDDPGVSCIAMARPTRSEGMYAQCVGRGTRLFEGKQDCLILDFVDVSTLSLCSLPSLFGCPRDLDLRGGDVGEAREAWDQVLLDQPDFELEAGALTLREIQDRAAAFDPLTLEANPEIRAISANAWFSLGRRGVGVHFQKNGETRLVTVLRRGGRGKVWEAALDGKAMERFSTLEQAVEAADYEIDQLRATASAREEAPWRTRPAPPELLAQLRTPAQITTLADALRRAVWEATRFT